jgi:2-polyprenyl-3-methyl-5-hydroxy-6-metoxy-1,4-benzoquinol methylase
VNIPYRQVSEFVPVDVAKLRPGESYRQLLEKRTHVVDDLVRRFGRVPDDLLIDRACPTCSSVARREELRKDHLTIVRCSDCDLVYVNPIFDEAHYRAVYSSAEYQGIMRDLGESSHAYRVERFGRERVDIMARYLRARAPGRPVYLDVGCSTGFVVEAAAARGWQATGIDLNPSAVEFGRTRGLDLRQAALEDGDLPGGGFDAISLFDVLEHLVNPIATVAACIRLLAPEGILFLYVPNYDSASRLLMGADAHFIWPTHHLNYYTPVTIADLLARADLQVELVATEGLDFADYLWHSREVLGRDTSTLEPIADTLQFLANAGAYGKNLRVLARRSTSMRHG